MSTTTMGPDTMRRRITATAALAAPVASAIAVVAGIAHTANHSRQLDIVAAHPLRFTAMLAFEHLLWVALAVMICGLAGLVSGRGRRVLLVAAPLAVIGAAAEQSEFGPMLVPLARMHDRAAALYAVDHLGAPYLLFGMLSPLALLALVLAFVGAWRAGLAPAWTLPVLLAGLVLVNAAGNNNGLMLLAAAVVIVPMVGLARALLRRPAPAAVASSVSAAAFA